MSEQWYAWEHAKGTKQRKRYPGIIYVNPELGDEQYDKTWEVYPVIIRPVHEEPCPLELSPSPWASLRSRLAEVGGEPNPRTWLNLLTGFGYKFCPNCGRMARRARSKRWLLDSWALSRATLCGRL